MKNYTQDNRGSATILMALIAAIIITVGLGFNWLVREHISASEGLKNKAEAILKARSAYDTIIYLILNSKTFPKEAVIAGCDNISVLKTLPLDGREIFLSPDVRIRIQDSNGVLSLINVNKNALRKLIKKVDNTDNSSIAIDSLLDWTEAGNLARINGAKDFYYKGLGVPYTSRNYAIQYMDELKFIRGIGEETYNKIKPYVSMLRSTGFNPNTASDEVLRGYLDIDDASLKAFRDYLSQGGTVKSNNEFFALTGKIIPEEEDSFNFVPSVFMDITVSVGEPKNIYTIKAGLRINQRVDSPFSIFYWQEV
jgi:general secretion pathway protein K